jgi:hypothetical protein
VDLLLLDATFGGNLETTSWMWCPEPGMMSTKLLFLFDQPLLLRWSFFPSNLPVPMPDLPTLALPILPLAIPLGSAAPWVFQSFEPANEHQTQLLQGHHHQTISGLTVSKTSTAISCKIPAGAVIAIGAKANVTNAEFFMF